MMTETPILFTGEMVRAILAGRKTQTRRPAVGKRGKPFHYPGPRSFLWVRETWAPCGDGCIYRATHTGPPPDKWRPSIHMPRAACRLRLRVVSSAWEELHGILPSEAQAEGVEPVDGCYRAGFRAAWDAIYGGGPSSWDARPFVIAMTFTVAEVLR